MKNLIIPAPGFIQERKEKVVPDAGFPPCIRLFENEFDIIYARLMLIVDAEPIVALGADTLDALAMESRVIVALAVMDS